MPRSLKKGPYVDPTVLKKMGRVRDKRKERIRTWSRHCTIIPDMIGYTFEVHNGKDFVAVVVHESMVGHKLGEFSPSTKFVRHGGRIQRELESETKKEA